MIKIRCPKCKRWFEEEDHAILDEFYTIKHKGCYNYSRPVKDKGIYEEIIINYFSKDISH